MRILMIFKKNGDQQPFQNGAKPKSQMSRKKNRNHGKFN